MATNRSFSPSAASAVNGVNCLIANEYSPLSNVAKAAASAFSFGDGSTGTTGCTAGSGAAGAAATLACDAGALAGAAGRAEALSAEAGTVSQPLDSTAPTTEKIARGVVYFIVVRWVDIEKKDYFANECRTTTVFPVITSTVRLIVGKAGF